MNKRKAVIASTAILAVIIALAWRPVVRTDKPAPVTGPPVTAPLQQVVATEAPSAQVKARVARAPASHAPAVAWRQLLTGNIDFLQFLKAAVPAAKAGDGRAAWYIGQGLHMCMAALRNIYGGHPEESLEAQLQQELAQMPPNTPQYLKDELERKARRCFSLSNAKENPWGGPPQTPEQWMAQAYAAADPLAQVDVAARAVADIMADAQMPEHVRAAKVKVVQDNLRAAVKSGDPDALYSAGMLVANNEKYTFQGLAAALAACDLGRDCAAANPESGFYECVQSGRCPPGLDFPSLLQQLRQHDDAFDSIIQRGMGQEQYAQVYERSQQVVQLARAGDYQGVLAYLTHRQASQAR